MKRIICIFTAFLIIASSLCISAGAIDYADNFPNTHRNTGKNLADLIAVAKTQIGYTELSTRTGKPLVPGQDGGYTKYGAWFGMPTVAWCAFFVTWCSNQAGISTDVIPRMGNCAAIAQWFQARNRYFKSGEVMPRTGDLIFYNWAGGSNQKHIGIVTGVSKGYVYTVEGNTGSKQGYRTEAKSRSVHARYIIGYARPDYNDALTFVGSYSFAQYAAKKYKFASSRSGSVGTQGYRRTSTLAVATSAATDISAENAVLHGRIDNLSSYPVTQAGFFFGESRNNLSKIRTTRYSSKKSVELECDISSYYGSLEMLKTYYYRAYAVLNGTTYKGPVYSVTTVDDRPQMLILSDDRLSLSPGETYELLCAVLPLEARDDGVRWSVSDGSIAEVKDGVIRAKSMGSVTVSAVSNYGSASAECSVSVTLPEVTGIRSENVSENRIKLLWEAGTDPELSGFEIYRSELPDDDFTLINTVNKNKNEYTDSGVEPGKCYYYKIRAAAKTDEFSSPLSEPHREKALPAVPEIKNIIQKEDVIQLEISGIDDGNSYTVYRSTNENGGYSPVGRSSGSCFYDDGIILGEKYYYRVSADGAVSQSRLSDPFVKKAEKCPETVEDFIINMFFPKEKAANKKIDFNNFKSFDLI